MAKVVEISKCGKYRICEDKNGEPLLEEKKDGRWKVIKRLSFELTGPRVIVERRINRIRETYHFA